MRTKWGKNEIREKENYYEMDLYNMKQEVIATTIFDLDNQRKNLRIVTRSQNGINSKKTIGAYFDKNKNKWTSEIFKDGKKYYIGTFINKKDALKAREIKEKELYGEFAQKRCY